MVGRGARFVGEFIDLERIKIEIEKLKIMFGREKKREDNNI